MRILWKFIRRHIILNIWVQTFFLILSNQLLAGNHAFQPIFRFTCSKTYGDFLWRNGTEFNFVSRHSKFCIWLFFKEDTIYDERNLSNLVKICAKLRCSTIYSTLSIQTPGSEFVKLDFERIFKRVIENKNGGLCYERDEILFQLLKYIGLAIVQFFIPRDPRTGWFELVRESLVRLTVRF